MTAKTKACLGCRNVLPIAKFARDARSSDNCRSRCRLCSNAQKRASYRGQEAKPADPSFWTPEREEQLAALCTESPGLDRRVMAEAIGCSRNAVIGKIHRKKLVPPPDLPDLPERPPHPLALITARQCHFVIGDPSRPPYHYCGAPVTGVGSSWCDEHRRLVYRPAAEPRA